MRVGLIDYGSGNLGSVSRALEELPVQVFFATAPEQIENADRLILPGVGNFGDCRKRLDAGSWTEPLLDAVTNQGKPLLGICVGMQLLATSGAEGSEGEDGAPGLDLIPGRVEHLSDLGCKQRIPHVGWNAVSPREPDEGAVFAGIPDETDFYFTHSYAFVAENKSDIAGTAPYDIPVTAAVRRGKVWGTQFHPEKSSRAGLRIIRNFVSGEQC